MKEKLRRQHRNGPDLKKVRVTSWMQVSHVKGKFKELLSQARAPPSGHRGWWHPLPLQSYTVPGLGMCMGLQVPIPRNFDLVPPGASSE